MPQANSLKDATLIKALQRLAQEDPDREAFTFVDQWDGRVTLSRTDVWEKSRKFAAILKRHGIKKGDVVADTLVNSPQSLISMFGTLAAGAISTEGEMYSAKGEDLLHDLRTAQCKAIILEESENIITPVLNGISYKDDGEVRYKDLPDLKLVMKVKVRGEKNEDLWPKWLEEEQEMFEEEDIHPDDICIIFHTSGTTGFTKLVPQTHKKLLLLSSTLCKTWEAVDGDILYNDRSFGWIGGYPNFYIPYGNKIVVTNHSRGSPGDMPNHILKVLETERCNYALLSGFEMGQMMNKLANPLPRLLKTVIPLGGQLVASIRKAAGVLSHRVCVSYGGSEFGIVSSVTFGKDDHVEDFFAGSLKEGVEIKILNDNLEPVEKGQRGEIFVRSPLAVTKYVNNYHKTKESFLEDGWFRTKDLGFQDGNGHLYVIGRKANVIMRGIELYYTAFPESLFRKCPGIKDLALIGVPDPEYFEEFCLCIVPNGKGNLTEDNVLNFCKSHFVENGTTAWDPPVPPAKNILFFDEFPLNHNMKMDRASLKAQACQRLGIDLEKTQFKR